MTRDPRLATTAGTLRGRRFETEASEGYYGIPYAAAPVASRRWAPPAPPAPWTGERDARGPAPVCPQPSRPFADWAQGRLPGTDEDSLVVNVWRPSAPCRGGARPVVLFLHGGGWALGWGANALHDGRHLARALDAVVVTANYRLGSLGWLYHPALATERGGPCGNWGLLDQLAALRWVAEHAPSFGGDPARITLAGESAGAGSVLHLLGRPDTRGLIHRAITLSPPLHELSIGQERAVEWTEALCVRLGAGAAVPDAFDTLRRSDPNAVVAAQEDLLAGPFRGTRGGAMPVLDPATLACDPAAVPGAQSDVPLMIGTNADEGTFFFRAAGRRNELSEDELGTTVKRIAHVEDPAPLIVAARRRLREARQPDGTNDVLCAVATEAWFVAPVRRYASARARAGGVVHRYRIDHPSPDGDLGALHTISVPLVFGSWREGGVAARLSGAGPRTAAVSDALAHDWARFVHGHDPGWEPVTADRHAQAAIYGGPGPARVVRSLDE